MITSTGSFFPTGPNPTGEQTGHFNQQAMWYGPHNPLPHGASHWNCMGSETQPLSGSLPNAPFPYSSQFAGGVRHAGAMKTAKSPYEMYQKILTTNTMISAGHGPDHSSNKSVQSFGGGNGQAPQPDHADQSQDLPPLTKGKKVAKRQRQDVSTKIRKPSCLFHDSYEEPAGDMNMAFYCVSPDNTFQSEESPHGITSEESPRPFVIVMALPRSTRGRSSRATGFQLEQNTTHITKSRP